MTSLINIGRAVAEKKRDVTDIPATIFELAHHQCTFHMQLLCVVAILVRIFLAPSAHEMIVFF